VPFTANTNSQTLNKALIFVAEKPAIVAAAGAIAANPASAVAFARVAASSGIKTIKSVSSSLSPLQKLGFTAAAIIAVPTVAKSATAKKALSNLPSALGTFTTDAANVVDNPSMASAKTLITNNPLISAGIAAGTLGIIGLGTSGIVSNIINTSAVRKNTQATLAQSPIVSQLTESGLVATNKYDVKVAEAQGAALEAQYKAQLKGIQDTNDANLSALKSQNEALSKQMQIAGETSPVTPAKKKKAPKKKKKTVKKKAKPKKKAKNIKRKSTKKKK
jgi:hypothetical protein